MEKLMLVAEYAPETSLVNNPSDNGKCLNNITHDPSLFTITNSKSVNAEK